MPAYEDLLKKFPPEVQEMITMLWGNLPSSDRNAFLLLLNGLPSDTNLIRLLIQLSTRQIRSAFGSKHRVAIVGPANVGKSTLYNQLVQQKQDHAEVSPLPGTTRINQAGSAGLFTVVDTPGADAVGEVGEAERSEALSAAREADFLIIVFDAIQGVKQTEQSLFTELSALKKPYVIVINKADLVKRDLTGVVERAALNLNLNPEQIVSVSAQNGHNVAQVLMAVAMAEPEIVAALGQAMPQYRWQLARRAITSAASIAAVIALTPLPMLDFGPLLVTQSVMVLGIARIYNYRITLARARELVVTFGLGFLGRTLFQELSKLGGIPGWVLSAAIASSTTVVMGYAAANWFEKGEKISGETLKVMTANLTQTLMEALRHLGKQKPSQQALQDQVNAALDQTSIMDTPPGQIELK